MFYFSSFFGIFTVFNRPQPQLSMVVILFYLLSYYMYKEIVTSKQSKEFREKYICVSNLHFQSNQTVSLSELDLFHSTKPTQNTAGTAGL